MTHESISFNNGDTLFFPGSKTMLSTFNLRMFLSLNQYEVDMSKYVRKFARVRYASNGIEYALIYDPSEDEMKINISNHRFIDGTPNYFRDTWTSVEEMSIFKATLQRHRPLCMASDRPQLRESEVRLILQFQQIAQIDLQVIPPEISTSEYTCFDDIAPEPTVSLPCFPYCVPINVPLYMQPVISAMGNVANSFIALQNIMESTLRRSLGFAVLGDREVTEETPEWSLALPPPSFRGSWVNRHGEETETHQATEQLEVKREGVSVDDVLAEIDSHIEENEIEPLKPIAGAITQHKINQFEDGELREIVGSEPEDPSHFSDLNENESDDNDEDNVMYFNQMRELTDADFERFILGQHNRLESMEFNRITCLEMGENAGLYGVTGVFSDCAVDDATAVLGENMNEENAVGLISGFLPTESYRVLIENGGTHLRHWLIKDRKYIPIHDDFDDTPAHLFTLTVDSLIFALIFAGHEQFSRYSPSHPICDHNDVEIKRHIRWHDGVRTPFYRNSCKVCGLTGIEDKDFTRSFVDFDAYTRWKQYPDSFGCYTV